MNINFQNIAGQKNEQGMSLKAAEISERSFPAYTRTGAVADVSSGLHLDIDATGFSDNAYAGHKRNMDEITNAAQGEDVRNRHNYMALLSNTMSGEDYAKAMEDGFDIKSTDAKETVTIVDKIKSVLLQSGEEIAGFNDDLSLDKLKKITGSEAFANSLEKSFHDNDIPLTTENVKSAKSAYEQIEDIKSLDDSAVKYLVLNDMEPTIENIYFAAHSTNGQNMSGRGFYAQEMGGYYAQKADSFDWEQLSPQIDKVIEEAGLSAVRNKSKENARWMVQQGIPLTAQNLEKLNDIKSIDFPVDESKGAEAIAAAIADGKKATAGNVADPRSNLYKAADLVQQVNSIDDSALKENIIRGKELTIRNLTAAMSGTSSSVQSPASTASVTAGAVPGPASSIPETDERLVSARLQLEEVRLRMTVEANKQLLDSGYSIDTSPMEDLIEHLKATLSRQGAEAAGGAVDEITGVSDMRRGASLHFTMTRIAVIAEGPADVVGELSGEFESASLLKISQTSERMTARFRQAGEGYEKLMTSPRADLGDSIKKAFRNVDDILRDQDMEINDDNRRAVRILGYNRMEISTENIEKVRAWDEKLKVTIKKLKPGAVLELIRDGKNPLSMTIDELSESLDKNPEGERGSRKDEDKYSRFLYKLERKGGITKEEKSSFIGIYRLFNTLKKTDYQAIGSLLKTDQEMTIGNLLNATRNQRAARRGVDVTADESFAGIDLKESSTQKIDEQISASFRYYSAKAEVVYENLEPEKLMNAGITRQTYLADLADDLESKDTDEELDRAYVSEQIRQIRQVAGQKITDDASSDLTALGEELSFNNLEAQIAIRRERRSTNLWEKARDYPETALLSDNLSEEDYEENYVKLLEKVSDKLTEELMTDTDSYIDVRAISLMQKQLTVMGRAAESGSFEVPVEIEGEKVSMHVTLRSDDKKETRMDASVQTFEYGLVTLSIRTEGEGIRGMLTTTNGENREEAEYLEKVRSGLCERIRDRMKDISLSEEDIAIIYRTQYGPAYAGADLTDARDGSEGSGMETVTLLTMAKAFIEAL